MCTLDFFIVRRKVKLVYREYQIELLFCCDLKITSCGKNVSQTVLG